LEYEQSDKYGTFTDYRDGKVYKTVEIGSQIWMAENLAFDIEGSVCYGNDESNCQKYGRLYSFGHCKEASPPGWHVPRRDEWAALMDALMESAEFAGSFSAQPSGYRDPKGNFHELGEVGTWWSYSVFHACSPIQAWIASTKPERRGYVSIEDIYLFSIRCVKDNERNGG